MDVWTRTVPIFGKDEPTTIHLAGTLLKEEKMTAMLAEYEQWQAKVIVNDTSMKFHRCAPVTENKYHGFKSSNQLDRLKGILKDHPLKLSLRTQSMTLAEIPSLNVVLNPSVDTPARAAGLSVLPALENEGSENIQGFVPGPHEGQSWLLEQNKIPVQDYHHERFRKIKGHDFK